MEQSRERSIVLINSSVYYLLKIEPSGRSRLRLAYLCCIPTIIIMISITTVLQIHIHIQSNAITQDEIGGLCCSDTNSLLHSDFCSSTRGERHNSYYVGHTIWPHQRAAHLAMFKISAGRDLKKQTNPTTSSMLKIQLSNVCLNGRNSHLCLYGPMSTLNSLFFKILIFSGTSLTCMTLSTLQTHFLSGGLLWQWWFS